MSMESKKRKTEGNKNGVGEETEIDLETARKVMEPFTREQLLHILAEAYAKHSDVAEQVRDIAGQQQQQKVSINQPQQQPQPQRHHHLGSNVQMGGGISNTGFNAYQGLSHNGMSRSPNPGSIHRGSMLHSANPSSMNQGLSANPNTSNPVPSSLGMSGGYAGDCGAPQVGRYSGSQRAGAYGHMGAYGDPPVYEAPAPPSSSGFSETGRNCQPSYEINIDIHTNNQGHAININNNNQGHPQIGFEECMASLFNRLIQHRKI